MAHDVLINQVRRVIGDPRLLEVIERILGSHHDQVQTTWPMDGDLFSVRRRTFGLPIGNLTSQFFANIYLNPLDHFVKHELRIKGYVRYVDDFILFGDDRKRLRDLGGVIRKKVGEWALEIHPDKYRLLPTKLGVDFVGFVMYGDGRIRLRSENVRRFILRMRQNMRDARQGRCGYDEVSAGLRSWIAHAAHAQSWHLRKAVFRTI